MITIGIIIVAVLILTDPFQIFEKLFGGGMPHIHPETTQPLSRHIEEHHTEPAEYIVNRFSDAELVFLGAFSQIKEHAELVKELIPRLQEAGIHTMGMQFALSQDQQRIDDLITGSTFDREEAEQLLFRRLSIWGYQEYVDLFRTAWQVNQDRAAGEPAFRIVGLGVRRYYEHVKEEEDAQQAETVQKVFREGVPDAHMAEVIQRRILDEGKRALIFTEINHAFTHYDQKTYEQEMEGLGFDETRRAGNIIHDRIGDRALTVLLHSPWPKEGGQHGLGYALGGVLDNLLERLDEQYRHVGFDVPDTPFADLEVVNSTYAQGYDSLTFADLAHGYVFLGPVYRYSGVTSIPNFITAENLDTAKRFFPGPVPDGAKAVDLNNYIERVSDNLEHIMRRF
jgi:hypothetical protein